MLFQAFNKIARLSREMVITEKIDGTNAQIYIVNKDDIPYNYLTTTDVSTFDCYKECITAENDTHILFTGSRTRWIYPGNDNHGFAYWAKNNADELFKLGEGHHFGEWWGSKIQRGYGIKEKYFSLFNVSRFYEPNGVPLYPEDEKCVPCPACCKVVPILYKGMFDTCVIESCLHELEENGSKAVYGYMNPEGIVIYHTALGKMFKKTIEKDELPKSLEKEE